MKIFKIRHIAMLAISFLAAEGMSAFADTFPWWLPDEARYVVALASTNHPSLMASRLEHSAASEDRLALDSFYEPSASVAGGVGRGPASAPEAGLSPYLPVDSSGLQGGVFVPLRAGAYVGAGVAQRRIDDALTSGAEAWQSIAGVRLNVPLLRDRGFALQDAKEERADRIVEQRNEEFLSVLNGIRRDVAVALAYELYSGAVVEQYKKALSRVETLLDETSNRVALETVARYQVYPAEMEVQFKLDDVRQYSAAYTNAHFALSQAVGGIELPFATTGLLSEWAALCVTADVDRVVAEFGKELPEVKAARLAVEASRAREKELEGSARSSLSLSAGVSYQGENEDFGIGTDALLRDDNVGFDVALVWSRPFSFESEKAALRAQRARTQALRERERLVRIAAETRRRQAESLFIAATERMAVAQKALDAANKALKSELERLSLGEGSSRSVLDAQTDLTSAESRSNAIAYNVICSFLDLMLASGVDFGGALTASE